jgi:hypothetical protein
VDRGTVRAIVGLWLVWAVALLAFQVLVAARFGPERPDTVLEWTAAETGGRRHALKPILQDQAWPGVIEWDSEFYLSIATAGYEDPLIRVHRADDDGRPISLNHAFMPLYPFAMRVVAAPMGAIGVPPMAAATIAGVLVSLVSALFAMLAVAWLAMDRLGRDGAVRAALYLAIFPTGFFLAMVYTEALFLALAFGSMTQVAARRPVLAGLLAALATLTRPVGVALAIPLLVGLIEWWRSRREPMSVSEGEEAVAPAPARPSVADIGRWLLGIALPLVAYAGWSITMGADFDVVQREFFGRVVLDLGGSAGAWSGLVESLGSMEPRTLVYYGLEAAAVLLAVVASIWALRQWPGPALFGLVAILVPLTSGAPQSLVRYALAVPAIFLLLAALGRRPVVDRGWALVSTLLFGLLLTLFTFDFWVA